MFELYMLIEEHSGLPIKSTAGLSGTIGRERIGTVDIGNPTVLNLTFSGQLWSSKRFI